MKKLILLSTIACLALLHCSKDDSGSNSVYIDVGAFFTLLSPDGKDLLLPETEGSIPVDQIKVYYLKDGVPTLINVPFLDVSNGYRVIYETTPSLLSIHPNSNSDSEPTPENLIIELPGYDNVNLDFEYERQGNNFLTTKVFIDGELVWEIEDQTERLFTLVLE